MSQITKFYLSSFLKNQTYFVPVLIIFLQAQSLDFQQIFWVFTIGSIASFILEIPTGVFADLYGKKQAVVISKLLITLSFITFGFSSTFWMFVLAQVLFEIGNSFRTGSESAFIYDYLQTDTSSLPSYTEVKGKQKFWARLGESIATAVGGVIAGQFGYSWVFFLAAFPAFLNLLNALSWTNIPEERSGLTIANSIAHMKTSLANLWHNKTGLIVVTNITIFTAAIASMDKFIQPYMSQAGVPIEYFGFIYATALLLTAFLVRYSYLVERRFGAVRSVNGLTLLAAIPAAVIGSGYVSLTGVFLFFIIILVENIRSPVANNIFHTLITSRERSTLGSILSQSKSLGKIILLPIIGYVSDSFSLFTAMLVLSSILLLNGIFFYFRHSTVEHCPTT